jgi:hypothetical protein
VRLVAKVIDAPYLCQIWPLGNKMKALGKGLHMLTLNTSVSEEPFKGSSPQIPESGETL